MSCLQIPQAYTCCLTKNVMLNPVVMFKTGEICDQTSIDERSSEDFIPLPGLKSAIQKFQQTYQNNQPQEISNTPEEEEEEETLWGTSIGSDLNATTNFYQQKIINVKDQLKLVSDAFELLQIQNQQLNSVIFKLRFESEKFTATAEQFEKLQVTCNTEDISKSSDVLAEQNLKMSSAMIDGYQKINEWYVEQKKFEQQLMRLERKEIKLTSVRKNLSQLLQSLGIQPAFTTEFESCSKKFRKPQELDTVKFKSMIKTGFINNACMHIESTEEYIDIDIKDNITIQNMTFINSNKGALYIRFLVFDDNTKIQLQNCKFQGIGLVVKCLENPKRGEVILKNADFTKVPGWGIAIENCNKFFLQKISVQGCGVGGIGLDVNEGSVEDVHVQECGFHGIRVVNVAKPLNMKNCSFCSCKDYGLCVYKQNLIVQGTNITFEKNAKGNVYGNFNQY
eukprot:TRINITY_DN10710_c0_g1_i2.p1 TRINITY_DN10710_c0_g1~~TRINITY_DN10710_c0_g1_i2.p1  ORF type:complete len:482 (-),score=65.07 TRINITY_DN10710_c0_g1_i2:686-2038(-)